MLGLILALLIGLISLFIPGFLLALALLRKTGLNIIELSILGLIFGLMWPATLTWLEAYLINYISAFSFSLPLFFINCIILSVVGFLLCLKQGAFKDFKAEFLSKEQFGPVFHKWIWMALIVLMILTFATRMLSIGISPTFFEFDPYFTMVNAQYILTFGQQLLLDPAAWPSIAAGTNHRVEPIIPYLEAFWYDLANTVGYHYTTFNTTLMSYIGSIYPPITASLLVFTIFLLLYKEYNEFIGIIGAGIASAMPVLFTTFIAGEQLLEPWGIFALFFFLATYMLAVKNPKSKRLAVLAGIAFVSNFLGAHYYTVTTGVFVVYILFQGVIDLVKRTSNTDFYKMNAIVIIVIGIFFALFNPYSATLSNRTPAVLGIPIILAGPLVALLLIASMDYIPKLLAKRKIIFKEPITNMTQYSWIGFVILIGVLIVIFTPLGAPVFEYLNLSAKFTTPSSPLFMTVEEYIPTGLLFNFASQGFGPIGMDLLGIPLLVWVICAAGVALILLSIIMRNSRTGILYLAIALPLMFAGFSEVKYLPHFGVAYIMLFCIILGEGIYYAEHEFRLFKASKKEEMRADSEELIPPEAKQYSKHGYLIAIIISIGVFFFGGILAIIMLAYIAIKGWYKEQNNYIWGAIVIFAILIGASFFGGVSLVFGESASYVQAFGAAALAASSTSSGQLCNSISAQNNSLGYTLYCNTVPQYWLNAMSWIKSNVGPNAPRVLAWWDYGDWINWFGNTNAVLRGDNANATEDYATAAQYVLGPKYGSTPQSLASFMNGNQTKYVLFDQDLISKWQALDFLACIYVNATTKSYAIAQGQAQNPPTPYLLGTSQCELQHDPQFVLIPLAALVQNQTGLSQSISYYCSASSSTQQLVSSLLVVGSSIENQSVCVSISDALNASRKGALRTYYANGTRLNMYIQSSSYIGIINVQGVPFVQYLAIYAPNGPNGTITDAPTQFYTSNYYKGFVLGNLPGFTEVYPNNITTGGGVLNMINASYPVRIYELNNFTGTLPRVPIKPPYVNNNYTMP
jgi:hypothetical protein